MLASFIVINLNFRPYLKPMLTISQNVYARQAYSTEKASKTAIPARQIQSEYLLIPRHLYQIFQIYFQNHKKRN